MSNKFTDFEKNPLFTAKELNDAVSFTASIISEAVRTNNFNMSDWQEYIDRWGYANYQTEEVLTHIGDVICSTFNNLKQWVR